MPDETRRRLGRGNDCVLLATGSGARNIRRIIGVGGFSFRGRRSGLCFNVGVEWKMASSLGGSDCRNSLFNHTGWRKCSA